MNHIARGLSLRFASRKLCSFSISSLRRIFLSALIVAFIAPQSACLADEPRHATAEGDNPNLNEGALQNTKPGQQGSTKGETGSTANWQKLSGMFENLTKEYFAAVKLKKGKDSIRAEYKVRPWEINTASKVYEDGPNWGGILYDVKLQSGPYAGVHVVPKKFNEYSVFSVELFAPYSKKYDCHLLSRISYPFDVNQDFLKRFKKLVKDFEQYL